VTFVCLNLFLQQQRNTCNILTLEIVLGTCSAADQGSEKFFRVRIALIYFYLKKLLSQSGMAQILRFLFTI
jgi:hypothetical protein